MSTDSRKSLEAGMTGAFVAEASVQVRFADTDAQGVAYYASYLVWFEVGRVAYLRQRGMTYADLEQRGEGVMIVEALCRYHAPARFDDALIVRTWCDEVRRTSFRFRYEVRRGDILLADGHTVQVYLDMKRGQPKPLPEDIRRLLSAP